MQIITIRMAEQVTLQQKAVPTRKVCSTELKVQSDLIISQLVIAGAFSTDEKRLF